MRDADRVFGTLTTGTSDSRQSPFTQDDEVRILSSVLAEINEAVVVTTPNGEIAFANAAAEVSVVSRPTSDADQTIDHQPRRDDAGPPWVRAANGETLTPEDLTRSRAFSFPLIKAWPVKREDGTIIAGAAIFQDTTKSIAGPMLAERDFEKANRAKSDFLFRMSLELRTQLNSILGFAQMLSVDAVNERQLDSVKHILNGGYRLLELVDETLDLARIDSGILGTSPEPLRVTEVVTNAVLRARQFATQRAILIDPEVEACHDWHVRADRRGLRQVLLNILTNAVRISRPGDTVRLAYQETPGNRLRIKFFAPLWGFVGHDLRFWRGAEQFNLEVTDAECTGLALGFAKHVVETMGGRMGMEASTGPGAELYIELGLIDDPFDRLHQDAKAILDLNEENVDRSEGVVLYIEDNASNRTLIQEIFACRPRVKVLTASSGQAGLDIALRDVPDWIMLDLNLPDMSGERVLQILQGNSETAKIPLSVLSGDATPDRIAKLIAGGARDYIAKPFGLKTVLRLLEATIPRRGLT